MPKVAESIHVALSSELILYKSGRKIILIDKLEVTAESEIGESIGNKMRTDRDPIQFWTLPTLLKNKQHYLLENVTGTFEAIEAGFPIIIGHPVIKLVFKSMSSNAI